MTELTDKQNQLSLLARTMVQFAKRDGAEQVMVVVIAAADGTTGYRPAAGDMEGVPLDLICNVLMLLANALPPDVFRNLVEQIVSSFQTAPQPSKTVH